MRKKTVFIFFLLMVILAGNAQQDRSVYFAASRLDYYMNELAGEVLVFVPDSRKDINITIDLVFEFQVLIKAYPVSSQGVTTVPFKLEMLREGENEITVSFNENGKWVDSRKVFIRLRPPRDNAVQIDRASGGLFAGRMPLIPFGFRSPFPVSAELPEIMAEKGYNYISLQFDQSGKSLKERKNFMNRCASQDIRVIYDLSPVLLPQPGNESLTSEEKLERIRKEVEFFSGHPALLGWQVACDPDKNGLTGSDLAPVYDLVRELDPYHPVVITLSGAGEPARYDNAANIFLTRFSPYDEGEISADIMNSAPVPDVFHAKPAWAIIGDDGLLSHTGNPAPQKLRPAVYLALIRGFSGIQFETRDKNGNYSNYPLVYPDCASLAKELALLTPDFTAPYHAPAMNVDNPDIKARAWNRLGLVTMVSVNLKDQPAGYKAGLTGSDISGSADVIFENRTIKMTGGAVEDMIDGYGTRIIRFDARHKGGKAESADVKNLIPDPGFEKSGGFEVVSACLEEMSSITGGTFVIDSRRHYEGEHSLRINNPGTKAGKRICFGAPGIETGKSYTFSVMARSGGSANILAGKKGGTVKFTLGFGTTEAVFECTDNWQKFEIVVVVPVEQDGSTGKLLPWIRLAGKGTVWFDSISLQDQP